MTQPKRPLSDAETTHMPELHAATQPMPRVDELCHYCEIKLSAIPYSGSERPRPYFTPGGRLVHCHPGCIGAQRIKDTGLPSTL